MMGLWGKFVIGYWGKIVRLSRWTSATHARQPAAFRAAVTALFLSLQRVLSNGDPGFAPLPPELWGLIIATGLHMRAPPDAVRQHSAGRLFSYSDFAPLGPDGRAPWCDDQRVAVVGG